MRMFYFFIVFLLIFSCQTSDEKIDKLKINELSFVEYVPKQLEYIELYNQHDFDINIDSLYILINQKKHVLTERATIKAGEFIFKELNITTESNNLQIKLNLNGRFIDEFYWENTETQSHVGRFPDGSTFITTMPTRSMGKTNNSSIIKLPKPKFNLKSGFYNNKIHLKLNAELSNIPLYFTLDGSNPTRNSNIYQDSLIIDKNSVVKAKFIYNQYQSPITNLSFFINEDNSLPVISIIVDSNAMWNDTTGIMKDGFSAEDKFPYKGANYWKNIKLPAYSEYFDQNKKLVLSEKTKIKIHGNYSKVGPLKSIRLIANNKNKKLEFTPFENKKINMFSELVLRNSGQDALKVHFRDAFIHNYLGEELDIGFQSAQPVIVFINGDYYGLLHLRERYNTSFFETHFGTNDNYNLLKLWGVKVLGENKSYIDIREKIGDLWSSKTKRETVDIKKAVNYFDLKNWIDYFIVESYAANLDWIPNNTLFWSSKRHAKWKYLLVDLDAGLGSKKDTMYKHDMFDFLFNHCSNKEFSVFMSDIDIRNQFLIRYTDLLNTSLNNQNISAAALEYQSKIEHEIPRLFKKYLNTEMIQKYELSNDSEIILKWKEIYLNQLYTFFEKRPSHIKNQLKKYFQLHSIKKIEIFSDCSYTLNSLSLKNDFSGEYFSGLNYTINIDKKTSPHFSHFNVNGKKIYSDRYEFNMETDVIIHILDK